MTTIKGNNVSEYAHLIAVGVGGGPVAQFSPSRAVGSGTGGPQTSVGTPHGGASKVGLAACPCHTHLHQTHNQSDNASHNQSDTCLSSLSGHHACSGATTETGRLLDKCRVTAQLTHRPASECQATTGSEAVCQKKSALKPHNKGSKDHWQSVSVTQQPVRHIVTQKTGRWVGGRKGLPHCQTHHG